MNTNFYKAFEDRFRGSRESIKNRLAYYLPLITLLRDLDTDALALDVGCGRGEWLELLGENGFNASGVDLDPQMLLSARALGLSVQEGDAIDYLKSFSDNSALLISGFHIAEHLPFEVLMELITQSLRVLKPGGLLILETPNPENIAVGANTFYTDPTHNRPLPPALLSFLPEYTGFGRTTIFRLNAKPFDPHTKISIFDVITGASPDYAVIAQKTAPQEVMERFDKEWLKPHGVSMDELALRNSSRIEQTEATIEHLFDKIDDKERLIHHLNTRVTALNTHLDAVNARFEWEIEKIYNSYSWKITAPLRWIFRTARRIKSALSSSRYILKKNLSKLIGLLLRRIIGFARVNPITHWIVVRIAHLFPGFAIRMKKRLYDTSMAHVAHQDLVLSPRANRIYEDLKHAIDVSKGEK